MSVSQTPAVEAWKKFSTGVLYTVFAIGSLVTIFPFLWAAILSTRSRAEIFTPGISLYISDSLMANYEILLEAFPFWTTMMNSLQVTCLGVFFSLIFMSMAGYAFAVYNFKGKNFIFGVFLASLMVPPVLAIIPFALIIQFLGLLDTHLAIWLPFTAVPFGIFLVRQYVVTTVPLDLMEAARMDGAGEFRIFWNIALPLMRPVMGTLAIIQFVFFWNNFLIPLIVLSSPEKQVVVLVLRAMQGLPNSPWGAVMLGTTISMLPIIVFYALASKQMIASLTSGAVKG